MNWLRSGMAALLGLGCLPAAMACTCGPREPAISPAEELEESLARNPAVVLVDVIGDERRHWSLAFSAEHLSGQMSPWLGADFVTVRVLRSWSPGVQAGQQLAIYRLDGAACGYEAWHRERRHLLVLRRQSFWTAGLCGFSAPASQAADTLRLLERRSAGPVAPISRAAPAR